MCVSFGHQGQLVGTLNLPDRQDPALAPALAFVLLNAGVIPRMGPHRFNVKLARHLAGQGIPSLRFDLSGRGDSPAQAGAEPGASPTRAVADLQAAMDHLCATTGIRHFVIAGICSGAFAGFAAARHDPRIMGLWMLDGHVYPTWRGKLARVSRQLRADLPGTLRNWARRPWQGHKPQTPQAGPAMGVLAMQARQGGFEPTRTQFAQAMQALVDRGVQVYMMFSADVLWRYSYQGQFRDTFAGHGFVSKVVCEHMPHIDHTLTTLQAQQDVMQRIGQWANTLLARQAEHAQVAPILTPATSTGKAWPTARPLHAPRHVAPARPQG